MGSESIRLSVVLPASAERIYKAWLDGREHAAFTGGKATSSPKVGGRFTAWDGYIEGTHLELKPQRRIIQSWRTSEFPEGSPDSRVEVVLDPASGGTRLTLLHSEIPAGQGEMYRSGWVKHYFEPMKVYSSAKSASTASSSSDKASGPDSVKQKRPLSKARAAASKKLSKKR